MRPHWYSHKSLALPFQSEMVPCLGNGIGKGALAEKGLVRLLVAITD